MVVLEADIAGNKGDMVDNVCAGYDDLNELASNEA